MFAKSTQSVIYTDIFCQQDKFYVVLSNFLVLYHLIKDMDPKIVETECYLDKHYDCIYARYKCSE